MIPGLNIRPSTPEDAGRVQELRKLGWQDNYVNEETGVTRQLLETELAALPVTEADLQHYQGMLANPQNHNLVAELDGQVVGTVFYDTLDDGTGDIGVFIDREHRGASIGSALLHSLVSSTTADLQVIIFAKNKSRGLYKKFGFKESAPEQKHYFDEKTYLPTQTLLLKRH